MFSLEGLLCTMLLISIIASLPQLEKPNTREVILSEKLSDLLIVWARGNYGEEEMWKDARGFLGEGNFKILKNPSGSDFPIGSERTAKEIRVHVNGKGGKITLVYIEH